MYIKLMLTIMLAFLTIQPAEARGRMGEDIALVHDLPDVPKYSDDGEFYDLGYIYRVKGFFGIPLFVSTSEARFVIYRGDRYFDLDPKAKAELVRELGHDPTAAYNFNMWRHIWGWLILFPLIAIGVVKKFLYGDQSWGEVFGQDSGKTFEPQNVENNRKTPSYETPKNRPVEPALTPQTRMPGHPTGGFGRKGV